MSNGEVWGGRLARALSLRVIALSLVAGVGLAWPGATMPTVWTVAIGAWAATVWFNTGQMVKCDACRKRVKLGADRCHHCGYARG